MRLSGRFDVVLNLSRGRITVAGRSTGPHLRYEAQVNVSPSTEARFLLTGDKPFGGARRRDAQD
jgi:hypothetical protein